MNVHITPKNKHVLKGVQKKRANKNVFTFTDDFHSKVLYCTSPEMQTTFPFISMDRNNFHIHFAPRARAENRGLIRSTNVGKKRKNKRSKFSRD